MTALHSASPSVARGELFGFLGPNGAGKTTAIRILATLLRATSGSASVAGIDVAARPREVRKRLGAMQTPTLDAFSTGQETLELAGAGFIPALLTKSEQATSTITILFFPIVFMSTAFVPETLMPGWMQVVNAWNPFTYFVEALRAIMVEGYDWAAIG